MSQIKHIEDGQTELNKSVYELEDINIVKNSAELSFEKTKAYNALDMADVGGNVEISLSNINGKKDYDGTAEFIANNPFFAYSCSFSSDFKVIGTFDWSTADEINYVYFKPTHNRILVIVNQ